VQALGGAKNHMIVLPDADMELAADAAVGAGYGSAGERCMAISMVVAVGAAADKLIPKIKERIAKLKVGPARPGNEMGPLITRAHRDKVAGYVDAGVARARSSWSDGRTLKVPATRTASSSGRACSITCSRHVDLQGRDLRPGARVVTASAPTTRRLALVNENPYANGVALFTNDGGAARKFQHEVEVGMVGINVPIPVPMAYYSFGGWKASLFGDLHVHGTDGVRFYTRTKVVTSRWPDPRFRGVDLGFPQNK
jgi:malonate-semialdehyde dehydrogenase (acetylating)/methylmalonate-semialdehyde dehydrogenase